MANNKLGDVSTDIFFHYRCVVLWTNNSHSFLSYDDKVQAYVALWHVHLPLWVHRLPHGHFPTSCIFRCGCCQNYCTRCFCVSNHLYLSPRLPFLHILYECMEEWLTEVSRHVSHLLLSWHHFNFILWVFPKFCSFPSEHLNS